MIYNDVERFFGLNTGEMTIDQISATRWRRVLFALVCIAVGVAALWPILNRSPTPAEPVFPCADLKVYVSDKIKARGVTRFTLDVVASSADAPGRVVATCEGGTKKIMFRRKP